VTPTVVVVGGGVAGLAAARALASAPGRREVVLLEATGRTGGALTPLDLPLPLPGSRTGTGTGGALRLDGGAESLLARRPEALALARQVGLGGDLVAPETTRAAVLSRGRLHPLPGGILLGVPGDPAALAGPLTSEEVARAAAEVVGAPVDGDVDVASWVGARLGPAVVERLVEPLLGGVYAGSASGLSLRAALPALWAAAVEGTSATAAVRAAAPARGATDAVGAVGAVGAAGPTGAVGSTGAVGAAGGPVFAGVAGGVWRLAEALATALTDEPGGAVRRGSPVTALRREGAGWRVAIDGGGGVGGCAGREELAADGVVLAVPPHVAASLLAGPVPAAAAALAGVVAASLALVTAVLPEGALAPAAERAGLTRLSGVLVPPVEGHLVKAMTFSSTKWAWVAQAAGGRDVLRLSVGRYGEDAALALGDDDLAAAALTDAAAVLGVPLEPLAHAVTRWDRALPQYGVGHAGRVAAARAAVAAEPGLALAGATLDGVGVPACIASAHRAAAAVLRHLDTP
jgi:oxygen-dependent protoporphyrinogen oxidase